MSEFSIIDRYFANIGSERKEVNLGVGDDAAIIDIPQGYQLCVSSDTLVEDVHFLQSTSARDIAHKLVAVNVSDLAAMGAAPVFATLAICLPAIDEVWLDAFSSSLHEQLIRYNTCLVGGDTTKGKLTLTLTIHGVVEKGKALRRSGAELGDDIYVSGCLGDAALGLDVALANIELSKQNADHVLAAHYRPEARLGLGQALVGSASSCIDVSDGLLADMSHICERSLLGAELNLELLPLSSAHAEFRQSTGGLQKALSGGDDYELLFTAPKHLREQLLTISRDCGVSIKRIGRTIAEKKIKLINDGQEVSQENQRGFDHFA